jgi:hypothetical protein
MLNAANAARFLYPQYMPEDHQTLPKEAAVTKGVIGYEGIIRKSSYKKNENLSGPVAQGDGPQWVAGENPEESQFSVYGSGHVGIFGSIINTTNVTRILKLDLLATDFYYDAAWPSFLYYNPYLIAKMVTVETIAGEKIDLYNTVTGRFIARNVSAKTEIKIPALGSAIIVSIPAYARITYQGNNMLANGIVVDYMAKRSEK